MSNHEQSLVIMSVHTSHEESPPIEFLTFARCDLGAIYKAVDIPGDSRVTTICLMPDIDMHPFPIPWQITIEQRRPDEIGTKLPTHSLSILKHSTIEIVISRCTLRPQLPTCVVIYDHTFFSRALDKPVYYKFDQTHQNLTLPFHAHFGFSFGDSFVTVYLIIPFVNIVIQSSLVPSCCGGGSMYCEGLIQ